MLFSVTEKTQFPPAIGKLDFHNNTSPGEKNKLNSFHKTVNV